MLTSLALFAAANAATLSSTPLEVGVQTTVVVEDVQPFADVHLFLTLHGEGAGPCPSRLDGACFDLIRPGQFDVLAADTHGTATFTFTMPARFEGEAISMQAVTLLPDEVDLTAPLTLVVFSDASSTSIDTDIADAVAESAP